MLFNAKTKDLKTSRKEEGSKSRVSQVLDIFRRFTSKFKRDHDPEPCLIGATLPPPPYIAFSKSQGIPAPQGRGTRVGAGQLEWKSKDQHLLLKSLFSHSVTAVTTQAWPLTSTKRVHVKRARPQSPEGKVVWCRVYKTQSESTRPKVKSYSGHPSTDRAEEMAKRNILFHRGERRDGMEPSALNHTRKTWSPWHSPTLMCFPFSTQKTIWISCAEATIQDKKSPSNSVTKSQLWHIRKKLKGSFGKQTCFS